MFVVITRQHWFARRDIAKSGSSASSAGTLLICILGEPTEIGRL